MFILFQAPQYTADSATSVMFSSADLKNHYLNIFGIYLVFLLLADMNEAKPQTEQNTYIEV